MNSGKTARLIVDVMGHLGFYGQSKVDIIQPEICTNRITFQPLNKTIKSRVGLSMEPTLTIDKDFDFLEYQFRADYLFIDEVNFLTVQQVEQLKKLSKTKVIRVYGLKNDYRSNLFPSSKRCLELADSIIQLDPPRCKNCTKKADVDHIDDCGVDDIIFINGEYISLCWDCWCERRTPPSL